MTKPYRNQVLLRVPAKSVELARKEIVNCLGSEFAGAFQVEFRADPKSVEPTHYICCFRATDDMLAGLEAFHKVMGTAAKPIQTDVFATCESAKTTELAKLAGVTVEKPTAGKPCMNPLKTLAATAVAVIEEPMEDG